MKISVIQLEIRKVAEIEFDIPNDRCFEWKSVSPIFIKEIGKCNLEKAAILCLDNTNKIINFSILSIGEINKVNVSIAQILRVALVSNASKIFIGHNHPSGVLEITSFDIELTRLISKYTSAFGIELIDSIVVNGDSAVSIRKECAKNHE